MDKTTLFLVAYRLHFIVKNNELRKEAGMDDMRVDNTPNPLYLKRLDCLIGEGGIRTPPIHCIFIKIMHFIDFMIDFAIPI